MVGLVRVLGGVDLRGLLLPGLSRLSQPALNKLLDIRFNVALGHDEVAKASLDDATRVSPYSMLASSGL